MKQRKRLNINVRKQKKYVKPAVAALSIMVAGTVAWNLMLPSYSLSNQTYCDESSHVHDEETCWTKVLTCGLEESDVTENTYTELKSACKRIADKAINTFWIIFWINF